MQCNACGGNMVNDPDTPYWVWICLDCGEELELDH